MKYKLFFDDSFEPKQTPICIHQKEAIEDLKQAYYLLQTSSASFIIQNRKIKPYIKYIQIKKIITNNKYIDSKLFLKLLLSLLSNIKDLHTELHANIDNIDYYYYPTPQKKLYISDKLFEKKGHFFILNLNNKIKGKVLSEKDYRKDNQNLFVPILTEKGIYYRMVKFSSNNSNIQALQLRDCTINFNTYSYNNNTYTLLQNICKKRNVLYWILPDYLTPETITTAYFSKYRDEIKNNLSDITILDNRFNHGGTPFKTIELIFDLFQLDKNDLYSFCNRKKKDNEILEIKHRISGPIVNTTLRNISVENDTILFNFWKKQQEKVRNGKSFWLKPSKSSTPHWIYNKNITKKIQYSGLIVILVSQNTTSFGELLFDYINKYLGFKNILLLGTNTCGAVTYSNPETYFLKNSGIRLVLSSGIDDDDKKTYRYYKKYIETKGFVPKYWFSTEEELQKTIELIIQKWRNHETL